MELGDGALPDAPGLGRGAHGLVPEVAAEAPPVRPAALREGCASTLAAAAAIDQAAGQHAMAAVGISALGLAWLHDRCDRFSTDFLRVTADFGLYTPLLFFVFSG